MQAVARSDASTELRRGNPSNVPESGDQAATTNDEPIVYTLFAFLGIVF